MYSDIAEEKAAPKWQIGLCPFVKGGNNKENRQNIWLLRYNLIKGLQHDIIQNAIGRLTSCGILAAV